jgi:hypothetical protein
VTYKKILIIMLTFKGQFSGPGIFNKMPRIFELELRISSHVSAWTQHYVPVPHKPREADQTIQDRLVIHRCLKAFS